jgi:hypothetical protein
MNRTLFATTLAIGIATGLGVAIAAPQALNLTQQQKQTIEQQLSGKKAQAVPASFTAEIGAKVPQSVILHPLPQKVASKIKQAKNDDYAKLKSNEILISSPTNRQVAAVIHENASTMGASRARR